jgi:serine phosphatase RsbU (regulator of sigma subunit)
VLAKGSDPRYTQVVLDALLDEFMASQQILRDQAGGEVLKTFLQEVVKRQKTMEEAFDAKVTAETDAKNILAKIDLERLKERSKLLSNERDDLRMALKSSPEDAVGKKERETQLAEEIERIGAEFTKAEVVAAKLSAASQRAETAKQVYQAMFERAENFQNMAAPCVEYIGILERASFAVEQVEDWKPPVLLGGASGAALGLVGGWVISVFIVVIGRSKTSASAGA